MEIPKDPRKIWSNEKGVLESSFYAMVGKLTLIKSEKCPNVSFTSIWLLIESEVACCVSKNLNDPSHTSLVTNFLFFCGWRQIFQRELAMEFLTLKNSESNSLFSALIFHVYLILVAKPSAYCCFIWHLTRKQNSYLKT